MPSRKYNSNTGTNLCSRLSNIGLFFVSKDVTLNITPYFRKLSTFASYFLSIVSICNNFYMTAIYFVVHVYILCEGLKVAYSNGSVN